MPEPFLIRGNVPAVVTPFNGAGEIQYDDLARLIGWHIGRGATGICIVGDNGESWALTADDRRRLAEATVKAAGDVPTVMGVSATTARQTVLNAEIAAEAGIDALMLGPQPYVMKATTRELVQRMETIHKAVPLPIVLYNSPRRTGISLKIETMRAITGAVNIVALKEATRDFFYLTHVIENFSSSLAVLVGPAPFIVPGLQLGAAGFISSGPELLGERVCLLDGFTEVTPEIRELHFALTRIYETLMALGTWPSALKAGHRLIGQPAGVTREPVSPLDPGDIRVLKGVLNELGVETKDG